MSSSFKLMKYPRYFAKEIKDFLSQKADKDEKYDDDDDDEEYENENSYDEKTDEEIDEEFNIKRHIGENDHEICKIIQKDLIENTVIDILNTYIFNEENLNAIADGVVKYQEENLKSNNIY